MNNVAANLARPEFSEGFVNWLATAPMASIEESYAESYKEAHGIKARWVYGAGYTREEFATMFVILDSDIKAEQQRQDEEDARFVAFVDSLGLTQWAADNGIKTLFDLWDHNYHHEYTADPEPLPYEGMVPGPLTLM